MDSGWDVKALHRLIVTSDDVQAVVARHARGDWRAIPTISSSRAGRSGGCPRKRSATARWPRAACSIARSAGRASSRISRPDSGSSPAPGKIYKQDQGAKLYRRSLYTFWRRTSPPPSMITFDAVSREVCTAKREVTATPLQSLVLLNDPQFVEAARVLARAGC